MKKYILTFITVFVVIGGLISAKSYLTEKYFNTVTVGKLTPTSIDLVVGSNTAPKTMEVIESLTCIHCQKWTREYFPEFKKQFIDTGKVRLIINDFPLDQKAGQAAILVQCLPEKDRLEAHNKLMLSFQDWAVDKNEEQTFEAQKRIVGATDEELKCSKDSKRWEELSQYRNTNLKKYKLIATPTFLIPPKALAGDDDDNIQTINKWASN